MEEEDGVQETEEDGPDRGEEEEASTIAHVGARVVVVCIEA